MENPYQWLTYILGNLFAEVFALGFLLGLAIFVPGILFVFLYLLSRILGRATTGTVIGATCQTREKRKFRAGEEIIEQKRTLYPVFEYLRKDGSLHRERGSEGGNSTLRYATGQAVKLLVIEGEAYDDVYDARQHGAFIIGAILCLLGLTIMWQIGSLAAAMGVGFISLTLVCLVTLVRAIVDRRQRHTKPVEPRSKRFAEHELRPIESFVQAQQRAG